MEIYKGFLFTENLTLSALWNYAYLVEVAS